VQQVLIARQQPVRHLFPLTGRGQLVAHAVQTALLAPARRVVLCGGEERGTWFCSHGMASNETFAFALELSNESAGSTGRLGLEAGTVLDGALELPQFFAAVRDRSPLRQAAAPGLTLNLTWH
jgi:hypothetical protein